MDLWILGRRILTAEDAEIAEKNHDLHQRWRYENREPLKAD